MYITSDAEPRTFEFYTFIDIFASKTNTDCRNLRV